MPRLHLRPLVDWVVRAVTQPRDELNRFQRTLRFGYDLGRYGARQLREGRAAQMAAALAFRVLFGLMPVLVVGTVLARALLGPGDFRQFVRDVFQWMGLYGIEITLGDTAGSRASSRWASCWTSWSVRRRTSTSRRWVGPPSSC